MIESIPVLVKGLSTVAEIAEVFRKLLRWKRGGVKVLLEEIKGNLDLCWMVVNEDVDPLKIVPELDTSVYDRLLKEDFDFNTISRKRKRRRRIQDKGELAGSDLASFIGKSVEDLVENIYDKIKELKRRYRVDKRNPKIKWRRRVINLHKRILLLIQHLRD